MPIGNGELTKVNLGAILEGLLKAGIDFILVGGLAAVVQGAPVTTMDVDIVHNRSPKNIAKLVASLNSIEAFHRRPDDKVIKPKEDDVSTATSTAAHFNNVFCIIHYPFILKAT